MEVTPSPVTATSRDYRFDQPITGKSMSWLDSNRFIDHYEVSGRTLTVHATDQPGESLNWDKLERTFIIPGLQKVFGDSLKVNTYAGR